MVIYENMIDMSIDSDKQTNITHHSCAKLRLGVDIHGDVMVSPEWIPNSITEMKIVSVQIYLLNSKSVKCLKGI